MVGPEGIFRIYGAGRLGDSWVSISYLIRLSERHQAPVTVSSINKHGEHKGALLREIVDVFDARERVRITRRQPTRALDFRVWKGRARPIPGQRWRASAVDDTVCYQLDGVSGSAKKNPPDRDLPRLRDFVPGYKFIRLGQPHTIRQNVEYLLRCRLFYGVCSGVSFIAHSVGVPTYLVSYRNNLPLWHQGKKFVECHGTVQLISAVRRHLAAFR